MRFVCLLVGCNMLGTDLLNFTCCHAEVEAADQTFFLTQSQYTDTGPTSLSGRVTLGVPIFKSLVWPDPEKSRPQWDSNPGSSALEADALTTWPAKEMGEAGGGSSGFTEIKTGTCRFESLSCWIGQPSPSESNATTVEHQHSEPVNLNRPVWLVVGLSLSLSPPSPPPPLSLSLSSLPSPPPPPPLSLSLSLCARERACTFCCIGFLAFVTV